MRGGLLVFAVVIVVLLSNNVSASLYTPDVGITGFVDGDLSKPINLGGYGIVNDCEDASGSGVDCLNRNNNWGLDRSFGFMDTCGPGVGCPLDVRSDVIRRCEMKWIPAPVSGQRCINWVTAGNANPGATSWTSIGPIDTGILSCMRSSYGACDWMYGSFAIRSGYWNGAEGVGGDAKIVYGSPGESQCGSARDLSRNWYSKDGIQYELPGVRDSANTLDNHGMCFDACEITPNGAIDYELCGAVNAAFPISGADDYCPKQQYYNTCLDAVRIESFTCDGIIPTRGNGIPVAPGGIGYDWLNGQGMLAGRDHVSSGAQDCSLLLPALSPLCDNTCGSIPNGVGDDICAPSVVAGVCDPVEGGASPDIAGCDQPSRKDLDTSSTILNDFLTECGAPFTGDVQWAEGADPFTYGEYSDPLFSTIIYDASWSSVVWSITSDRQGWEFGACGDDEQEYNIGGYCCDSPTDIIQPFVDTIADNFDMNGNYCVSPPNTCGNYVVDGTDQCDGLYARVTLTNGSDFIITDELVLGDDSACTDPGDFCTNSCVCNSTAVVPSVSCEITSVKIAADDFGSTCRDGAPNIDYICEQGEKVGLKIRTNNDATCSQLTSFVVELESVNGNDAFTGECEMINDAAGLGGGDYKRLEIDLSTNPLGATGGEYGVTLTDAIPINCYFKVMKPTAAWADGPSGIKTSPVNDGFFMFGAALPVNLISSNIDDSACGADGCSVPEDVSLSVDVDAGIRFWNAASSYLINGSCFFGYDHVSGGSTQFLYYGDASWTGTFPGPNWKYTATNSMLIVPADCEGVTAQHVGTNLFYDRGLPPVRSADWIKVGIIGNNDALGEVTFSSNECTTVPGSFSLTKTDCTEGYDNNNCWENDVLTAEVQFQGTCGNIMKVNVTELSSNSSCGIGNLLSEIPATEWVLTDQGGGTYRGSVTVPKLLDGNQENWVDHACLGRRITLDRVKAYDVSDVILVDGPTQYPIIDFWVGACRIFSPLEWGGTKMLGKAVLTPGDVGYYENIPGQSPITGSASRKLIGMSKHPRPSGFPTTGGCFDYPKFLPKDSTCDPDDDITVAFPVQGDCSYIDTVQIDFEFLENDTDEPTLNGSSANFCFKGDNGIELRRGVDYLAFKWGGGLAPVSTAALLNYHIPEFDPACVDQRVWATKLKMYATNGTMVQNRTFSHNDFDIVETPGPQINDWITTSFFKFGPIPGFDVERFCGSVWTTTPFPAKLRERACKQFGDASGNLRRASTLDRPDQGKCPTINHCLWLSSPANDLDLLPGPASSEWDDARCIAPGEHVTQNIDGIDTELVCIGNQQNGTAGETASVICPSWDSPDGTFDDVVWEPINPIIPALGYRCREKFDICDTGYDSSVWTNPPNPVPNHILTCDQTISDIFLSPTDIEKCYAPAGEGLNTPGTAEDFPKSRACCPFFTIPAASGEYEFYQDESIVIH